MKLIKLIARDEDVLRINPDYIVMFFKPKGCRYTELHLVYETEGCFVVNETPEEIIELIKNAEEI
jgi:hypothetical protein